MDDLRLKPVQSRRLLRAIEDRRLRRAIEDIDVDETVPGYRHTTPDRSATEISQRMRLPSTAAESIAAATRALQHAQASRAERTMMNATSNAVDVWSDSVMSEATGSAVGAVPTLLNESPCPATRWTVIRCREFLTGAGTGAVRARSGRPIVLRGEAAAHKTGHAPAWYCARR